jgi:hypothetical protein
MREKEGSEEIRRGSVQGRDVGRGEGGREEGRGHVLLQGEPGVGQM